METRFLSLWDALVGSAAPIMIIILALWVMIGVLKRRMLLPHLGVIVGIAILLAATTVILMRPLTNGIFAIQYSD